MAHIFVDGKEGTTGLQIFERLENRQGIEFLVLSEEERKHPERRREMLNAADIAFLCLPDAAAKESVSFVDNDRVRIIDASTAHRTDSDWAYGFPELSPSHLAKIKNGKRISVPGCHASGFIALIYPLIEGCLLSKESRLSVFSLTGYSGGGKSMIADYRRADREQALDAPRIYANAQNHKHLPEMQALTGLHHAPIFVPTVADYAQGMLVSIPLFRKDVGGMTPEELTKMYKSHYRGSKLLTVLDYDGTNEALSANRFAGRDSMELQVMGNKERMLLTARYDNLGKGAAGAAVQCMNILLGREMEEGLIL